MSGLDPTDRSPEAIFLLPLQADKPARGFTEKQNKLREFHLVISELNSPYGGQYLADSGHLISSY